MPRPRSSTGVKSGFSALRTVSFGFPLGVAWYFLWPSDTLAVGGTLAFSYGAVAETSNESVHTIEQQYEIVRTGAEEQRKRTSATLSAVYEEASGEVNAHPVSHVAVADACIWVSVAHRSARSRRTKRSRMAETEAFTGLHKSEREFYVPMETLVIETVT